MAEIVGGFTVPHLPLIVAAPGALNERQAKACFEAFAYVQQRLRELDVDTVIVIGDDHYTIFGPACMPAFLIGIGDLEGPLEPMMRLPVHPIANNEPLATHIMTYGRDNGVDWAVAKMMTLEHSVYVPWREVIKPLGNVAIVPVYISSGVEPLVTNRRCYQIGQSIAAAVRSWEGSGRIAIFGTGGIAHWPALDKWEELNPAFDHRVMAMVEKGDLEAIIALSDAEVFEHGGNGGWEIKNWICMLGALDGQRAKLICYEPTYEWGGTCAFMELTEAAT